MSVPSPNITMKPEPRPSLLHRIPDATLSRSAMRKVQGASSPVQPASRESRLTPVAVPLLLKPRDRPQGGRRAGGRAGAARDALLGLLAGETGGYAAAEGYRVQVPNFQRIRAVVPGHAAGLGCSGGDAGVLEGGAGAAARFPGDHL